MSYADLHLEITKNVKDIPQKTAGDHQKPQIGGKAVNEEELVKYMSKLPSYLERGEKLPEKVLNVGVLDWGRLEKWQYSHKQIPYKRSGFSTSSSNTSPSFSTDGSSSFSSRGHSCSPAHQRIHRPSLQFHLLASPIEGHSQGVNSFGECVGKIQDIKTSESKTLNGQEKFMSIAPAFCKNQTDVKLEQCKPSYSETKPGAGTGTLQNISSGEMPTAPAFCKNQTDVKLEECKPSYSETKPGPRTGTLQNISIGEMPSCQKVKFKCQDGEFTKREENLQKPYLKNAKQDIPEGCKTVVLLLPRSRMESSHSGMSSNPNAASFYGRRSAEASRRSFSDRRVHADLNSNIPHSCPLPREVSSKESQVKKPSSGDAAQLNFSSVSSDSELQLRKMAKNPSKDRSSEEKKSTIPSCLLPNGPSKVLDPKPSKAEKARSTSPFCRFSSAVGKTGKSSSAKDMSDIHNLRSTDVSAKSGSENGTASVSLDASSNDKPTATSRARSSPLRRLLEPLLKPKAENSGRSVVDPLERRSVSRERACKSLDGQPGSFAVQSGKVKLDMIGCKTINVNNSGKDKKDGPRSAVQALLRVVVKNGLPLVTFAVEKESDILAATVKRLNTTVMDDCSCMYTFFTIREVKKKNGSWINQGGKGKAHNYIHNVVAQMKVSDLHLSNLTPQNQLSMREFILFSVDLRQADNQTSVFQPNDELAAIVVKILRKIIPSSIKHEHHDNNHNLSRENLKDSFSGRDYHRNSGENVQSRNFLSSQEFVNTTVILPSGIHSLPSKGGPSSLIERWNTGGSCDCGGWDLGCKLRILADQNQVLKKLSSPRGSPVTDRVELYPEGAAQEKQPLFCLAPFKDGVYSVEFSSSLSNLQAFSICIAVLDGRNLRELSESCNTYEEKTSVETMLVQNSEICTASQIEGEIPRYVSYPPLSPVGRV